MSLLRSEIMQKSEAIKHVAPPEQDISEPAFAQEIP